MLQCSKRGQSMTPLDWMKQERERLLAQIERLQSGAFRIGHDNGSGWVDATADHIASNLASLAEYDLVLAQAELAGPAVFSAPVVEQASLPF